MEGIDSTTVATTEIACCGCKGIVCQNCLEALKQFKKSLSFGFDSCIVHLGNMFYSLKWCSVEHKHVL